MCQFETAGTFQLCKNAANTKLVKLTSGPWRKASFKWIYLCELQKRIIILNICVPSFYIDDSILRFQLFVKYWVWNVGYKKTKYCIKPDSKTLIISLNQSLQIVFSETKVRGKKRKCSIWCKVICYSWMLSKCSDRDWRGI